MGRAAARTRRGGSRVTTVPAAFLGHGSPMNALETNPYVQACAEVRPGPVPLGGEPTVVAVPPDGLLEAPPFPAPTG